MVLIDDRSQNIDCTGNPNVPAGRLLQRILIAASKGDRRFVGSAFASRHSASVAFCPPRQQIWGVRGSKESIGTSSGDTGDTWSAPRCDLGVNIEKIKWWIGHYDLNYAKGMKAPSRRTFNGRRVDIAICFADKLDCIWSHSAQDFMNKTVLVRICRLPARGYTL
jgi:hypothetical protein